MCFSVTIPLPSFEEYPLNTDAVGSAPPDAFGPFRVLHQIGAGALGPVFRAYQPEQDRLVAVKLFRLDLPPERTHQFVAELEKLIAADLTHPGIAAPLAAGITDVSAYLAQDFVAADSLDIVIRDTGRSDPADVARIVSQLGGALDLAAAVGITHGALHPRDVLLSPDDARITGIGVTRALEQVGVVAPIRRPYTAPERAAGRPWDRRADVFSLAALVIELLSRRRIAGAGDQAVDTIGDIPGANPDALRRAFSRALAEEPRDRFATAGDFAKAVQAALDQKRTVGGRPSSRNRAIAAGAASAEPPVESTTSGRSDVTPLPVEELPLLTDEMLSAGNEELSPAADAMPPPIGGPERFSDVSEITTTELGLSTDDFGRSTVDAGLSTIDHRLSTNDEIIEPEIAEVSSRPAPLTPTDAGDRSASNVWPLMLALVVGIALGFGMAMLLLGRDRVPSASEQARSIPTGLAPVEIRDEPIREFTERAVPEPPKAAPPVTAEPSAAMKPSVVSPPSLAGNSGELRRGKPTVATQPPPAVKPAIAKAPVARKAPVAKKAPPLQATKPSAASVPARATSRGAAAKATPVVPVKTGPGSLAVDSRPTGASVFLDGKLIGTTPLVVETMGAGEHAIHLDRDGYRRWATAVRIVSGERSRVAASLER